nr:hypothetical protein [Halioglobus japonicus]
MILADEPTASLDKESGRNVVDLLQVLCREQGAAVILVTHDNRILDVADRILHLEDGEIKSVSEAMSANTSQMLRLLDQHDPESSLYLSAFSLALTRVAMADNRMDDAEREAIREVLNNVSGLAVAKLIWSWSWPCRRCAAVPPSMATEQNSLRRSKRRILSRACMRWLPPTARSVKKRWPKSGLSLRNSGSRSLPKRVVPG